MWKRTILVALCLIMLLPVQAQADEQRASVNQPTLTFSGTTALCEFRITDLGKYIQVTMELWKGSVLVKSWSKSGTDMVTMSETCTVDRGPTYTLKVSGTSDGVSFISIPVTKSCQ